jgi:hypothetical protein
MERQTHGGKRPGAGRKRLRPEHTRQTIAFSLPPHLINYLKTEAAQRGISRSELVTLLLQKNLTLS